MKALHLDLCLLSLLSLLVFVRWTNGAVGDTYSIGTGRYDVTGPAAEIEMVQPVSRHLLCESSNFACCDIAHTRWGMLCLPR